MPRKAVTYRFDERLIAAVKQRAKQDNSSANNWLETLLIKVLREDGVLPEDFEPLGETRGGDRTKGGEND
ncbi:hypothetical protein [Adonisia turfae]|nr:hypothetical protein [Adonisia turfae]